MGSVLHYASSPYGPWLPATNVTGLPKCNNPAPALLRNGTWAILCHEARGSALLLRAPHPTGPWAAFGAEIDMGAHTEDPFLYEDGLGNLHALFHAFTTDPSPAPPQSCAGALVSAHAFSGDGGLSWARSDTPPFGNEVALSGGGGPLVVATRERPKLVLDAARTPIALFTGASAVQTCPPASCCGCKYDGWSFTLAQETEV